MDIKLEELKKNIKKLNSIGIALSKEKDTEKLLYTILRESIDLTKSDGGTIYIVEKESDESLLVFKNSINNTINVEDFKGKTLTIDKNSSAGLCALNGEVIIINNFNKSYSANDNYLIKNMMTIPLKNIKDEVIGVLQILNKEVDYDEDDKEIVFSLASQTAILLDRIRLNNKLQGNISQSRTAFLKLFTNMKQAMAFLGEDILEEQEEFKKYATLDELTKVMTRKEGLSFLDKQIQLSKYKDVPLTICFIDVNDLKYVNDNFGHKEGDFLLKNISEIIVKTARTNDMLFRYGGDEFILILYNVRTSLSEIVWNRIEANFNEFNQTSGKPYKLSASHGFSEYLPEEDAQIGTLIKLADERMYINKREMKAKKSSL